MVDISRYLCAFIFMKGWTRFITLDSLSENDEFGWIPIYLLPSKDYIGKLSAHSLTNHHNIYSEEMQTSLYSVTEIHLAKNAWFSKEKHIYNNDLVANFVFRMGTVQILCMHANLFLTVYDKIDYVDNFMPQGPHSPVLYLLYVIFKWKTSWYIVQSFICRGGLVNLYH